MSSIASANLDFGRILTATQQTKGPDRVPFGELWVDPEVKSAFLGRPVESLGDEVEFWVKAGYDYIMVDTDLYATPQIQACITQHHQNTADQYRQHRKDRAWVASEVNAIACWDDVDNFPWPPQKTLTFQFMLNFLRFSPST
jgi:hypothetical protein